MQMLGPGRKVGLSVGAEMRVSLLTQLILESEDSLTLLGAAAEGKWSTGLGPFSAAVAPAMGRVQRAEAVCEPFGGTSPRSLMNMPGKLPM